MLGWLSKMMKTIEMRSEISQGCERSQKYEMSQLVAGLWREPAALLVS
jgi:hypothetical protein